MEKWQDWLKGKQEASKMEVTPISLSEIRGWEVTPEALQRPDGAFFTVGGVNIAPTAQREVTSWDQPMLKEVGQGAIVLVYDRLEGFLLQAKAEPGNKADGRVLLAPTLQASMSNLVAAHGGKKPPRAELVTEDVEWTEFLQDGGRYFEKSNNYTILEVEETIEATANERWFSVAELAQAIAAGYANEHLIQAFALYCSTIVF